MTKHDYWCQPKGAVLSALYLSTNIQLLTEKHPSVLTGFQSFPSDFYIMAWNLVRSGNSHKILFTPIDINIIIFWTGWCFISKQDSTPPFPIFTPLFTHYQNIYKVFNVKNSIRRIGSTLQSIRTEVYLGTSTCNSATCTALWLISVNTPSPQQKTKAWLNLS